MRVVLEAMCPLICRQKMFKFADQSYLGCAVVEWTMH